MTPVQLQGFDAELFQYIIFEAEPPTAFLMLRSAWTVIDVFLRLIGTFVNKQIWYLKTCITFTVLSFDMGILGRKKQEQKKQKNEWETNINW